MARVGCAKVPRTLEFEPQNYLIGQVVCHKTARGQSCTQHQTAARLTR